MPRLNVENKTKAVQLRHSNFTLNEIIKQLQLPKTTVFSYIKNIPLSKATKKIIKERYRSRLIAFNNKRKGVGRRIARIPNDKRLNDQSVFLLSHLMFDGQIKYSSIIYYNRNLALIQSIDKAAQKIFDVDYTKLSTDINGVTRVCLNHVEIAKFCKQQSQKLLNEIFNLRKNHKLIFLQSFFDDEGSVHFVNKNRRVRGYQKNCYILEIIKQLLLEFGIDSLIDYKYGMITIRRRKNLEKFARKINFSPGVSINPDRSNSVWKRPLEKREILKMALESYQKKTSSENAAELHR